MRAFIAIELEKTAQDKLSSLQEGLKKTLANIKLVETGNIHLTLRFLGEIDENKLTLVKKILEDTVSCENAFEISLGSLGAFPSNNKIKVIWVGVKEGEEILTNLAHNINSLLEKVGFAKPDQEFSAHITLARTHSTLNKLNLKEFLAQNIKLDARIKIKNIILFKSTLTAEGAIYERLYEANFKKI